MSARLTSEFLAQALIRRVHDAGGSAMLLRRGDATSGAILVVVEERAAPPLFLERGIGPSGDSALIRSGPRPETDDNPEGYWLRRADRDPDLWVIELSIPNAERFVAETILDD